MSKITLATFKKFLRENSGQVMLKVKSAFDAMTDSCESTNATNFELLKPAEMTHTNNLGFAGIWLVLNGRDHFTQWEDETHTGIEVYNCCGHFIVCKMKTIEPSNIVAFDRN